MAIEEIISDSSKFQVFLSFRGPDTRQGFTDTLFEYLTDAGIRVFRDNNELRAGCAIGDELMKAIEDSQIYIPIFSKTYAESKWCLRELAKMVETWRNSKGVKKKIIPIFCGVTVDDVKRKNGRYDVAVNALGHGEDSETVVQWKEALREVCKIKGWELKDEGHAKFCKTIVGEISIKPGVKHKQVADCLVGMDDQVKARNRVSKRATLAILFGVLRIMAINISGVMVFVTVNKVYIGKQADELGSWCDLRARVLQYRFIFLRDQTQGIGNFIARHYYSRNPVDSKEMQELLANYKNSTAHDLYPFIDDVLYAENVVKEERLNFESRHGWKIKAFDDNKDIYPRIAPVQDLYVPVMFCIDTPQIISLDMMSEEYNRENVLKARETGSFGISSPMPLSPENDRNISIGFILTYPLYQTDLPHTHNTASEDRVKVILGYTRVIFDFEAFAKDVFLELNDNKSERIGMSIYDITDSSNSIPMYGDEDYYNHDFKHVSSLELGDYQRKHTLICSWVEEELDYTWDAAIFTLLLVMFVVQQCNLLFKKLEELVFKLAYIEAPVDS